VNRNQPRERSSYRRPRRRRRRGEANPKSKWEALTQRSEAGLAKMDTTVTHRRPPNGNPFQHEAPHTPSELLRTRYSIHRRLTHPAPSITKAAHAKCRCFSRCHHPDAAAAMRSPVDITFDKAKSPDHLVPGSISTGYHNVGSLGWFYSQRMTNGVPYRTASSNLFAQFC
jgi:hypothetical protein